MLALSRRLACMKFRLIVCVDWAWLGLFTETHCWMIHLVGHLVSPWNVNPGDVLVHPGLGCPGRTRCWNSPSEAYSGWGRTHHRGWAIKASLLGFNRDWYNFMCKCWSTARNWPFWVRIFMWRISCNKFNLTLLSFISVVISISPSNVMTSTWKTLIHR